jgi:nitric oxide reductase NorE protein
MSVVEEARPRSPRAVPGEAGLWLFILADMTLFAVFFAIAIVVRADQHAMYSDSSAALHQGLGAANTLLLLTGSAFVALAVRATRRDASAVAARLFGLAIACALGFVAIKAIEWADLLSQGDSVSTNDFFQLYFMLTGMHLVHVLVGTGALIVIRRRVARRAASRYEPQIVEGGASYWHMVDLLWLVLFPLLYLMG